jgi:hypothetical protein
MHSDPRLIPQMLLQQEDKEVLQELITAKTTDLLVQITLQLQLQTHQFIKFNHQQDQKAFTLAVIKTLKNSMLRAVTARNQLALKSTANASSQGSCAPRTVNAVTVRTLKGVTSSEF